MKYVPLLLKNLLRKKTRTILTILSIAVALLLCGVLAAIHSAFYKGIEVAGADRLIVRNKISLTMSLPLSYLERIRQIDGVAGATMAVWFGGVYQDERNFFPQFAIQPEEYLKMFPEFRVPAGQMAEVMRDREACIAGKSTAEKYGWKIGDRIPIQAAIWGTGETWELNLRGIYTGTRPEDDTTQLWLRYDYLDERRQLGRGGVGWYTVRVANPEDSLRIAKAIDDMFANSPYETTSVPEKEFARGFVKQIGNIELLIMSIGGIVLFTLLLVTGNTMVMAVRERMGELAVLKTVGFSDGIVLRLVLAESLAIAVVGGTLGVCLAMLFTLDGDPTKGMLPSFYLSS